MAKYDKILTDLLRKFYTDNNIDEDSRKIVEQVINAEMNKLDLGNPYGIRDEICKIIQEVAETNIWNLYRYIYNSKELTVINESMNYGYSSLRNHLIVIANLIVQDFGKTIIQRNMHDTSK